LPGRCTHFTVRGSSGDLSVASGGNGAYPGWESFTRFELRTEQSHFSFPSQIGPDWTTNLTIDTVSSIAFVQADAALRNVAITDVEVTGTVHSSAFDVKELDPDDDWYVDRVSVADRTQLWPGSVSRFGWFYADNNTMVLGPDMPTVWKTTEPLPEPVNGSVLALDPSAEQLDNADGSLSGSSSPILYSADCDLSGSCTWLRDI
jgi:hypothetical protein